ncbi:MAG: hypothetical protein ACYC7D_15585 [Nitrososphaerales archaeon]
MKLPLGRKKILALSLFSVFVVSAIVSGLGLLSFSVAQSSCTSYPCSSKITITSYNGNDQAAISDLTNGKISAYDYQLTPVEASSLPSSYSTSAVPNSLYEVLVNPENTSWSGISSFKGSALNPFYYPQIRQALNYIEDRAYLVDNILGGAGVPILSVYGVAPDSLTVANATATYQSYLTYNFALANSTFYQTMSAIPGVTYLGGHYYYNGSPVTIYIADRTDDPFRSQYSGFLAAQLTNAGFTVVEQPMNLAVTRTTVFVENPVNGTGGTPPTPWDLYVGSFGNVYLFYGDFLQVCFDGANCAAPPYSDNLTGANAAAPPGCDCANGVWNTTAQTPPDVIALSDKLDALNYQILGGTYTSLAQRTQILSEYAQLEIQMGVNDWLATGLNVYGFNPAQITGLTASFTTSPVLNTQSYMSMQSPSGSSLNLGVRYLTQYNMNPVGGYGDAYSSDLLSGVFPTLTTSGPGTGYSWPFGWTYNVNQLNSSGSIAVPTDAVNYNATTGTWYNVTAGSTASLDVTANFANLIQHTGYGDNESVSLADLLYSYVVGMNTTNPKSTIYDSAIAPTLGSEFGTIVGMKILNSTSLELFSHYYFFDPNQAAITAVSNLAPYRDPGMPWTMYQAMADLVAAKDDAWAAATAAAEGIPQLTLVAQGANGNPKDISNLAADLNTRASQAYIPAQISQLESLTGVTFSGLSNVAQSYTRAATFLNTYNNGFIGYGPYYVSTFQAATTPNYAVLTANPNFKLGSYILPQLFSPASQISVSTTIPSVIQEGSTIAMTTLSTPIGQRVATPQAGVTVVVQLVNSTAVVNQETLTSGANGSLTYTVPSSVPTGAYSITIYASSGNSTIIVPSTYTATIVSAVTTTSTSSSSVSSTSSSTGSTTVSSTSSSTSTGGSSTSTSSTSSSSSTSSGLSGTTLTLAAVVIVIIIIAGVAVVVMRRR